MADFCTIFDQLRADIAQAQRWLSLAVESVSEQIEDESFSDGTKNPGAYEAQRYAQDHLAELERQFELLVKQINGELPKQEGSNS